MLNRRAPITRFVVAKDFPIPSFNEVGNNPESAMCSVIVEILEALEP